MHSRRIRHLFIGLLAILLVAVPAIAGCGSSGSTKQNEVIIAWFGDQTGPSATTFKQVQWGLDDYMSEAEAIPGVTIKYIVYDFRNDYARVPTGYEYLKGQGMNMLLQYNPNTQPTTAKNLAEDQIPSFSFNIDVNTMNNEWLFGWSVDLASEAKYVIEYLVNDWWETRKMTRPIKIGAMLLSDLYSGTQYWNAYNAWAAAHPGKCELTRALGTTSQTAFASEVGSLQGCDVIITGQVGPATATFLKELLSKGYQGGIVGHSISILSIWSLITSLIPKASLNGILIPHSWHVWTDQNEFVTQMGTALEKYRGSDAAMLKEGTTWLSGYCLGHVLTNVVRKAAETVGADKIDGPALRQAMADLRLEIPGMPTIGGNANNCLLTQMRMVKYDAAADAWNAVMPWANALYPAS